MGRVQEGSSFRRESHGHWRDGVLRGPFPSGFGARFTWWVALAGVLLSGGVSTADLIRSLLVRAPSRGGRSAALRQSQEPWEGALRSVDLTGKALFGVSTSPPPWRLAFGPAESREWATGCEPTLHAREGQAAFGRCGDLGQEAAYSREVGWTPQAFGSVFSAQVRGSTTGLWFAKELRLPNGSRIEVKVENPIGAGAAWTFGSGSETDSQAVTLCGARWPRLSKRVRGRVEKSALRLRGGEPQRGKRQEGKGVVGGGASARLAAARTVRRVQPFEADGRG